MKKTSKSADSVASRPRRRDKLSWCYVSVQGEIPAWHCRPVQVILHGLKQVNGINEEFFFLLFRQKWLIYNESSSCRGRFYEDIVK